MLVIQENVFASLYFLLFMIYFPLFMAYRSFTKVFILSRAMPSPSFKDEPNAITTGEHQSCGGTIVVGKARCREALGTAKVPTGGKLG